MDSICASQVALLSRFISLTVVDVVVYFFVSAFIAITVVVLPVVAAAAARAKLPWR
jgi:hypothetical protein